MVKFCMIQIDTNHYFGYGKDLLTACSNAVGDLNLTVYQIVYSGVLGA